jgi:hypothetical protein
MIGVVLQATRLAGSCIGDVCDKLFWLDTHSGKQVVFPRALGNHTLAYVKRTGKVT